MTTPLDSRRLLDDLTAVALTKAIIIFIAFFLLPVSQSFAATIEVDANCSLNQAIASANDPSQHAANCGGSSGADTIVLSGNHNPSTAPTTVTS